MPYQVLGGPTKDIEFQKYVEALTELGLPIKRDDLGRIGVVSQRNVADDIRAKMQEKVPYLDWRMYEVP